MGVGQPMLSLLPGMGIRTPTAVQVESWPAVMSCRNVAIQGPTGSGKTLAYLLPLLTRIAAARGRDSRAWRARHPEVLVLCPTQELCMQVLRVTRGLLGHKAAIQPVVGGANVKKQWEALQDHKPVVVVATPGRLVKTLGRFQLLPTHIERPSPTGPFAPPPPPPPAAAAIGVQDDQGQQRPEGPVSSSRSSRSSRGGPPHPLTLVLEEADSLLAMRDFAELLPLLSRVHKLPLPPPIFPASDHHDEASPTAAAAAATAATTAAQAASVGAHLADVLQRTQVIMVSASIKASTLAAAAAWAATQPITITTTSTSTAPPPPPPLAAQPARPSGTEAPQQERHHLLAPARVPRTKEAAEVQQDDTAEPEASPAHQQMLPDTITHQVLTYARDHHAPRGVARCLRAFAARGAKALVFVGAGEDPSAALQAIQQHLRVGVEVRLQVGALHGEQSGQQRSATLAAFNTGRLDALVTSDAFGLGLDYVGADAVIMLGALSGNARHYVARAGRTGRMGRPGTVLAVVAREGLEQHRRLVRRAKVGQPVKEMVLRHTPSLDVWLLEEALLQDSARLAQGLQEDSSTATSADSSRNSSSASSAGGSSSEGGSGGGCDRQRLRRR